MEKLINTSCLCLLALNEKLTKVVGVCTVDPSTCSEIHVRLT